jgi:hypothetical protein
MNIKITDKDDGNVLNFIRLLNDVSMSLETLGQIQACASGLSMEDRSKETFERKILLDVFITQIENNRRRDKR